MTTYTCTLPSAPAAKSWAGDLLQILGASLFIALSAQISVPLYFTPVPLSGQVLAVMLVGALLGSRKGVLAVLAYMAEGAMGLPVFAAGSFGAWALVGPTGGYFLGFIAQAYLAGMLTRAKQTSVTTVMAVLLFSCLIQLSLGSLWLGAYTGVGAALVAGFYPFLIGDALKCLLVAAYLKSSNRAA